MFSRLFDALKRVPIVLTYVIDSFSVKKTLNVTRLSIRVFNMNNEMLHKIQYRPKLPRLSILFNPRTSR